MSEKCEHEFDWENSYRDLVRCKVCFDIDSITDYINALEAELAELREREAWVSVSGRLPEDDSNILFLYQDSPTISKLTVHKGYMSTPVDWESLEHGQDESVDHRGVTHWRPLPAPPVEGVK